MNDIEHSPEENQEDIYDLMFDNSVSPGDMKVSAQPKHNRIDTRINVSGMFSTPEIGLIFELEYTMYRLSKDETRLRNLINILPDSDRRVACELFEKYVRKQKICVKIMEVFLSVALLREYGVLIVEDGIRFFKEMKRLKRWASTKTECNYYFSGVV